MTDFVQHPVVQALAWALVHFAWQGAAIGLVAFAAVRLARRSPSARYFIGVGALAAMVAAPVFTFMALLGGSTPSGVAGIAGAAPAALDTPDATAAVSASAGVIAPEVMAIGVALWLAGVVFFSIRLAGGWIVARRFAASAVRPAADHIQALARDLAERLAIRRSVRVLQSAAVAVPVMVGWLKPAIVLPAAALAGLSSSQVEALLAHELAHIRRHDYLVNLLQSVAEALLFYHPAVWWVSRRIRAERELCCDDVAVGVCDRLVYATALTDLAAMVSPGVALAATDGDLVSRVRRILGQDEGQIGRRTGLFSVLVVALVAGVIVPVALASKAQAPTEVVPEPVLQAEQPEPVEVAPEEATLDVSRNGLTLSARGDVTASRGSGEPLKLSVGGVTLTFGDDQSPEVQKQIEETKRRLAELQAMLKELEARSRFNAQTQVEAAAKQMEALSRQTADKQLEAAARQKMEVAAATRATAAQLASAKAALERTRELFDRGLVTQKELLAAETALAKAQAGGNVAAATKLDLAAALADLERSQQLFEKGLLSQQQMEKLKTAVADAAKVAEEAAVRQSQSAVEREELARRIKEAQVASADRVRAVTEEVKRAAEVLAEQRAVAGSKVEEALRSDQARRAELESALAAIRSETAREPLPASTRVAAGDRLRIVIDGEPALPTAYRVSADGTIRLPLLGDIKVAGLTAAQVRDAIGKILSDRKLGSASRVTVTVSR